MSICGATNIATKSAPSTKPSMAIIATHAATSIAPSETSGCVNMIVTGTTTAIGGMAMTGVIGNEDINVKRAKISRQDELLRLSDVARLFQVPIHTVYNWRRHGRLNGRGLIYLPTGKRGSPRVLKQMLIKSLIRR